MKTLLNFIQTNLGLAVIALAGIVIATVVSLLIWWRSTRRKQCSYHISLKSNLLTVDAAVADRVEILFDGVKTNNVGLVIISFENTGNEPIKREDFDTPLSIEFSDSAEIISAEVFRTKPAEVLRHLHGVSHRGERCQINPCLLNPGDSLTLGILVREYDGQVTVDGRIVGVKRITIQNTLPNAQHLTFLGCGSLAFGAADAALHFSHRHLTLWDWVAGMLSCGLVAAGLYLVTDLVVRLRRLTNQ